MKEKLIAENLSIVFAKSGKKTLVIGADLRRPKLYSDFGFDNTKGISNHILSNMSLKDVILTSEIENLDVLVSGPLPTNPSDALLTNKFAAMMENLKKSYDVIVLDTPPIGLVADALSLMKYSDINLYVARQSYTKKGLLSYINDMYINNRIQNLHIVFNDVKEASELMDMATVMEVNMVMLMATAMAMESIEIVHILIMMIRLGNYLTI